MHALSTLFQMQAPTFRPTASVSLDIMGKWHWALLMVIVHVPLVLRITTAMVETSLHLAHRAPSQSRDKIYQGVLHALLKNFVEVVSWEIVLPIPFPDLALPLSATVFAIQDFMDSLATALAVRLASTVLEGPIDLHARQTQSPLSDLLHPANVFVIGDIMESTILHVLCVLRVLGAGQV